ncbi:DUF6221 family protein [Streptomyces sp. NPDC002838]|uniref:DUF6221 family protein n=1 Tax=Streptomyces sp. NPDC002838 TaxID=3154436 RepID=UPI0033321E35
MAGMDELVRWLGEQLDEDERIARAATWCEDAAAWHAEPSPFGARDGGQRWYIEDAMDDGVVTHVDPVASDDEGVARHIAEWDPARVLREIDAKRELLRRYEAMAADVLVLTSGVQEILSEYRRVILPSLAAGYSDRPGYREEWRP